MVPRRQRIILRIHRTYPRKGVSNKGTSQSREVSTDSTSQQYSPRTTNNRTSENQSNPTNNNNNNHKNEINSNDNRFTEFVQSCSDKIGAITDNIKPRTTTTTTQNKTNRPSRSPRLKQVQESQWGVSGRQVVREIHREKRKERTMTRGERQIRY